MTRWGIDDDGFETRQKLRDQFYFIESTRDFLEWLFDYEIDYMTQEEAWEKFEQWQNKENPNKEGDEEVEL